MANKRNVFMGDDLIIKRQKVKYGLENSNNLNLVNKF